MSRSEYRYRNSAGRLLSILNSYHQNKPVIEFLPELMTGNPGKSTREKQQICFRALRDIDELYHQFLDDMASVPISEEQRKVMLSNLGSLDQLIYPMALNNGVRPLNDAEKQQLTVCATFITQEDPIQKEDLDKVRESVASLQSLVEKSDLDSELKKALLELIRLTDDAISRYNIHGARGLKKAFKTMLGEASYLFVSQRAKGKEAELKKSGAWAAVWKHITTLDSVVAKAERYKPYLEKGIQLLSGPDQ